MASETEICNLSLGHLGHTSFIGNLETEKSNEANICRVFYPKARDEALKDFPHSFSTKFASLALVSANPTTEWAYAYQYPTDCLHFRRILSGIRNDTRQSRVPYRIVHGESKKLIYTDMENVVAEYSMKVTETERYPVDFIMTLSFLLAFYIAPGLTSGDPFKLGDRALKLYEMERIKTNAANENEQQAEEEPQSEFERVRE